MSTSTTPATVGGAPRVEDLLAPRARRRPRFVRLVAILGVLLLLVAAVLLAASYGTGYAYTTLPAARLDAAVEIPADDAALRAFVAKESAGERQVDAELAHLAPQGVFIVVDQTQNRLYLKKGNEVLLDAKCSAGSGLVLKENPGAAKEKGHAPREFVFDTPRGLFKVKEREEKPVWTKPAWALIEEGKIPTSREDLVEEGTLGEYALKLGEGYMIHGTLYERLLGRSVTHGCIRLGRDDLRRVWKETTYGTQVFIY